MSLHVPKERDKESDMFCTRIYSVPERAQSKTWVREGLGSQGNGCRKITMNREKASSTLKSSGKSSEL